MIKQVSPGRSNSRLSVREKSDRVGRRHSISALALGCLLLFGSVKRSGGASNGNQRSQPAPSADKSSTLTITVQNEQGNPLTDAVVSIRTWNGKSKKRPETRLKTNKQGRIRHVIPNQQRRSVVVRVTYPNYADSQAMWFEPTSSAIPTRRLPKSHTFRLQPGIRFGGRIVDSNGRPIEKVLVRIRARSPLKLPLDAFSTRFSGTATTDKSGTWKTPATISRNVSSVSMTVEHSGYANPGRISPDSAVELAQLRGMTHRLTLHDGHLVEGSVHGPAGKPVKNAFVALQRLSVSTNFQPRTTRTDGNGVFRFPHVGGGRCSLTVLAKELAANVRDVTVSDDLDSVRFRLQTGNTLRIRVLDPSGKPVPNVTLLPGTWRNRRRLSEIYHKAIPHKTDKSGRLVWNGAPKDAIAFGIYPPDPLESELMQMNNQTFTARKAEYVVKLRRALRVAIRVIDKESRTPIPRFRVSPGERQTSGDDFFFGTDLDVSGQKGVLTFKENWPVANRVFRVSAKGYRTVVSRAVKIEEGKVALTISLPKARALHGRIVDNKGRPVGGANVYVSLKDDFLASLSVANGGQVRQREVATTDAKGRFKLDLPDGQFLLFVTGKAGYALVASTDLDNAAKIKLRRWSRIEGVLKIGSKPAANRAITLDRSFTLNQLTSASVILKYTAITDKSGRFVFTNVPSHWTLEVSRQVFLARNPYGSARVGKTQTRKIDLTAGKTTRVNLGGTGRPVVGRLQLPPGAKPGTPWHTSMSQYSVRRKIDANLGNLPGLLDALPPAYQFRIQPDGSFRIEDLPAGDYELEATLYGPIVQMNGKRKRPTKLGKLKRSFTIKPIRGGRSDEPMKLGVLKLNKG